MVKTEIFAATDAALVERLREINETLFNLRFQVATGKNPNPGQFRELKKERARIQTVQTERKYQALLEEFNKAQAALKAQANS